MKPENKAIKMTDEKPEVVGNGVPDDRETMISSGQTEQRDQQPEE